MSSGNAGRVPQIDATPFTAFAAKVRSDHERCGKVIRDAGVKLD